MSKSISAFVALIAFGLSACQNTPPPKVATSNQEKLANAFCECTVTLQELNEKAALLQNKTVPQDSINLFFQQLQNEYNNAKTCLASAIAQYGKLKQEDLEAVEKQIATSCPAMADNKDFIREMLGE